MTDTKDNGYEIIASSVLFYQFPQEANINSANNVLGKNFWAGIDHDDPMIVYMANGKINDLEVVVHAPEVRHMLNQRPLRIYLYEPLCCYIDDDPYAEFNRFNNGFYSEFYNDKNLGDVGAAELDSILLYIQKNRLYTVVVHTGDYQVEKYLSRYNMDMDLVCDDAFLKGFSVYDNVITAPKNNMHKKFISTNWRFTAARAVIGAILCEKDSHLGWYYEFHQDILDKTPWFDLENDKTENPDFYKRFTFGLTKLNQGSPWCLDFKTDKTVKVNESVGHFYPNQVFDGYGETNNPVFQNRETPTLEPYYRETFLDIVCESRYAQPTGNFSEKVLQSMHFMTPFVLAAPPYTLQYLKEFGFESFDKWWDESYDQEENHIRRMQKIENIIDYIDSLSWNQLNSIYEEMFPLLERNYTLLGKIFHMQKLPENYSKPVYAQWLGKEHEHKKDH